MEIREYSIYDETEILRLYQSVGWTAYTDHPEVLLWAMGIPSCLFKIFWCCRSISGKASAPHFCKLSWIGTAVYVKLSWQRIIDRKPLLFTGLWVSVKCQRSAVVDL